MALFVRTATGQVPSTAASQLAAPGGQALIITKFIIKNTSASAVENLIIYLNASGAGATSHEVDEYASVAAGEQIIVPVNGLNLYDGQFIAMVADTASVLDWTISYSQLTGNP